MKKYYYDYVNHILSFYIKNMGAKSFASKTDLLNWQAADKVFKLASEKEQSVLYAIYISPEADIGNRVTGYAATNNVSEGNVWQTLSKVIKKVAKERGIL